MAAKAKSSISTKRTTRHARSLADLIRRDKPGRWAIVRRTELRESLPPPGPSNIIILTPNPLPPPRDVKSQ